MLAGVQVERAVAAAIGAGLHPLRAQHRGGGELRVHRRQYADAGLRDTFSYLAVLMVRRAKRSPAMAAEKARDGMARNRVVLTLHHWRTCSRACVPAKKVLLLGYGLRRCRTVRKRCGAIGGGAVGSFAEPLHSVGKG